MKKILDDNFNEDSEKTIIRKTPNIQNKSILYLAIMICVGSIYTKFEFHGNLKIHHLLLGASVYIIVGMILGLITESIKFLNKKRKEKKYNVKVIDDPFWFLVLKNGFVYWAIIIIITFTGNHLV